jgi:hypothetical protein
MGEITGGRWRSGTPWSGIGHVCIISGVVWGRGDVYANGGEPAMIGQEDRQGHMKGRLSVEVLGSWG